MFKRKKAYSKISRYIIMATRKQNNNTIFMYKYGLVLLLSIWNNQNIINQLYSNTK